MIIAIKTSKIDKIKKISLDDIPIVHIRLPKRIREIEEARNIV